MYKTYQEQGATASHALYKAMKSGVDITAVRVSYVGELGWELYVPADFAQHVFDRIVDAGGDVLRHAGYFAINSLRIVLAADHSVRTGEVVRL